MRNFLVSSIALSALIACGSGGGGFLDGNVWGDGGTTTSGGSSSGGSSSGGSSSGGGSGGSSSGSPGAGSSSGSPGGDAGSGGTGPVTPGADAGGGTPPPTTTSTCTSGTTWTGGNNGSASMTPGQACIACHAAGGGEAPRFSIAGTVYPTANEPDDCNGIANVTVVITDATGQQLTLLTNKAGNFSSQAAITPPYQAKVVSGTNERAMMSAQTSGDCNTCHTATGVGGAPGRIMSP